MKGPLVTMGKLLFALQLAIGVAFAGDLDAARALYQKTEYQAALDDLAKSPGGKTAEGLSLAGQSAYRLGQFKKAIEFFEKAEQLEPARSAHPLWLGRAWGRRAETANPIMAPGWAAKARDHFERAVRLDPKNIEAVNDLLSYYLQAPGFLGGGVDKAKALAENLRASNPIEYESAQAQIAIQTRQYDYAERHLRKAVEQAPKQVSRLVELAVFLARHGHFPESEATFKQAEAINPTAPVLIFGKAETYLEAKRNLPEAKRLLEKYLSLPISPDDPPKEEAARLLRLASGG